jgi:hypothetical protein
MTRRPLAARRGITLTEILISILIMGIGLFPLGMVRLRWASQQHRSGLLVESATADLGSRSLLYKPSFLSSWYLLRGDPFTTDPLPNGPGGLSVTTNSTGLPICYDPLWWYEVGPAVIAGSTVTPASFATNGEFRFGQGVFLLPSGNTFVRSTTFDGGNPAAHGLQRITNYIATNQFAGFPNLVYASATGASTTWPLVNPELTFASPDDPVMQNGDAAPQLLTGPGLSGQSALSGVVPENFGGATAYVTRNDLRYTWLFTGYQVDATNGSTFVGNIVVMDSRPFATDLIASPTTGNSSPVAAGEIVMEGVYGYSANVDGNGFGIAADRNVLLRWPIAMPDPEIKVGSWICDATYQRSHTQQLALLAAAPILSTSGSSFQRCHWYQVGKKGDVQADPDVAGYRRMIVTTTTPVKDRTLLNAGGTPVIVNTALFMPSVVNVFQRAISIRP